MDNSICKDGLREGVSRSTLMMKFRQTHANLISFFQCIDAHKLGGNTNGIQLLTYKLHDKFVFFGIAAVRILLWSNRSKHKWVKKSNLVGGLACLVTSASLCSTIAIATGH